MGAIGAAALTRRYSSGAVTDGVDCGCWSARPMPRADRTVRARLHPADAGNTPASDPSVAARIRNQRVVPNVVSSDREIPSVRAVRVQFDAIGPEFASLEI